jgi:diguanylate cyclase (GGDEF)-like protein/PAS domain S-box-containing protein
MFDVLIANFAVVGLFISGWTHVQDWLQRFPRRSRTLMFGGVMGAGAIASMLLPVQIEPGVLFDLRSALIATSGLLGGPLAGLLTGVIAAAYRAGIGGGGGIGGLVGIGLAMLIGIGAHLLLRRTTPSLVQSLVFALATAICPLLSIAALPASAHEAALRDAALPVLIMGFLATFIGVRVLAESRRRMEERMLLAAALRQAPDYAYVKDTRSRFVAVNEAVARINGFADTEEIRGKSDFDVAPLERAAALFGAEQRVMQSGEAIVEFEEEVSGEAGPRWFLTNKLPIRNPDGEVIGLAGVTRDITERKALETELITSRNQLSFALTEMSDGLVVLDAEGRIVLCNQQYRDMFSKTTDLRVAGSFLPDILQAVVERGEQVDIAADQVEDWIAAVMAGLKTGHDEEVHMFDGRWLQVRTKPIAGGGATVVVSDITSSKQAELELMGLTEQLKLLATTDGLTGLLNRRAFDDGLELEIARARRSVLPISLIMLDIDRFKTFNDRYGHPAGDECLRRVAAVLRQTVKRPADLVARYGGEEFCAILPETDEDAAYFVAEALRAAVRDLHLEHQASEKGIVTISAGVASFRAGEEAKSPLELVSRADEALYIAKGAGRDRVAGWSRRIADRSSVA